MACLDAHLYEIEYISIFPKISFIYQFNYLYTYTFTLYTIIIIQGHRK
jgi:hypothetical protein